MNPLGGLWAVARKESIHIMRDRGTLFFALAIPVLQLLVFGFAIDLNVRHIPTVIYDQEPSQRSRELLQRFTNSDAFRIVGYVPNEQAMYQAIVQGRAHAAVKIPYDYATRILEGQGATVQMLVDGSDSTVASYALNTFNGIILQEQARLLIGNSKLQRSIIEGRPTVLFNPASRSPNFFVPGLTAILVQMMVILLIALSVVRERERGTLDQLSLTPVQPLGLMVGKMVPYFVLGMVEVCWILGLMRLVFQVPVHGNFFLLLLLTVPLLGAVLGLGLLISTRANTQSEAFQLAMGTMLPSIFLSGYIFPIDNMPMVFQYVSKVIPATYYVSIVRGIVLRGAGLAELWPQGLVLVLMATVLVSAAAYRFHKRLV